MTNNTSEENRNAVKIPMSSANEAKIKTTSPRADIESPTVNESLADVLPRKAPTPLPMIFARTAKIIINKEIPTNKKLITPFGARIRKSTRKPTAMKNIGTTQ